ncbi:MAG: ABC transporter permease [Clostridia bacterium]|nr:ABC transporter permease [Clostridia bacterium]
MIRTLFKRNLMLYFRHPKTVIMSFVSVFMMLMIYILFLGSQHVNTIVHTLKTYNISADETDVSWLVNCWVLGGLLSIVPFTASRAGLGVMVTDYEERIMRDLKSSPLRMNRYPIALILASTVIGMLMATAVFIIVGVYIILASKHPFPIPVMFNVIMIVGLHSFMCACFMSYPVSYMRTNQDYSTLCTVVDMLIGFINCVYIPVGVLPVQVQNFLRLLPFNQATELLRSVICRAPMSAVFSDVAAEGLRYYQDYEGVITKFGPYFVPQWVIALHMAIWSAIFFVLFTKHFAKKRDEI